MFRPIDYHQTIFTELRIKQSYFVKMTWWWPIGRNMSK